MHINLFADSNSLQYIVELHKIHDILSNSDKFPNTSKDYPLLYIYSLKSLNNYKDKTQQSYSTSWFDSLFHYATSDIKEDIIDITPRVISIIREYAKAKIL